MASLLRVHDNPRGACLNFGRAKRRGNDHASDADYNSSGNHDHCTEDLHAKVGSIGPAQNGALNRKTSECTTQRLVPPCRLIMEALGDTYAIAITDWNVPKRCPRVSKLPDLAAQGIIKLIYAPLQSPYATAKTMIPVWEA